MAENKKSVLLYCDLIHTVEELTDEEAGKLFKHYLRYINDKNPTAPDKLTQVVFEPIKQNLKRDLKKWESIVVKRSEAGLASAEKRKQNQQASTSVESVEQTPTNPTVIDTVNVTVIDTVTDIKGVEGFLPAPELSKSNLFRNPNIPTFDKVHEVFRSKGGTKEMAEKFFNNWEAVGWFKQGSPITNFSNMVGGFIASWKSYEKGKSPPEISTGSRLTPTEIANQKILNEIHGN